MAKTIPFLDDPVDFSLVQGGPLFQLMLRAGLIRPSMDLLGRRIVVIASLAWLPLLVLSVLSGRALGLVELPFLHDLGAHARFLIAVPLLIAAEVIVHRRISVTVRQFIDRGIVAPEDRPRFESLITSAMRLRNSVVAEVLLLVIVFVAAPYLQHYVATDVPAWFGRPVDGRTQLTTAGYWYVYVSLPIFRFLLLRWYFRLFVWYRFLWQVSRQIPLQLNALHPDRTAGLAFLAGSVFAFQPILVGHTVAFSGIIAGRILNEGAKLPQFKMEIVFWVVSLLLLVLTPLFFFMVHLAAAKRAGAREYGIVGSRYVREFRHKWIDGHAPKDEPLIGAADIQSLADLANSFEVVQEMRILPFGKATVTRMVIMTALPFAPLLLTIIPLDQMVDRVLNMLL